MKKLTFDKTNGRVLAEDDSLNAFYTNNLTCPDKVIKKVVKMYNEGKSLLDIDNYLLDEHECTTEDREVIMEGLFLIEKNQPKHTQGAEGKRTKAQFEADGRFVYDHNGSLICTVDSLNSSQEEAEANAQRIVKAINSFEAMREAMEAAREVLLHYMDAPEWNSEHDEAYEKVKTALKASE